MITCRIIAWQFWLRSSRFALHFARRLSTFVSPGAISFARTNIFSGRIPAARPRHPQFQARHPRPSFTTSRFRRIARASQHHTYNVRRARRFRRDFDGTNKVSFRLAAVIAIKTLVSRKQMKHRPIRASMQGTTRCRWSRDSGSARARAEPRKMFAFLRDVSSQNCARPSRVPGLLRQPPAIGRYGIVSLAQGLFLSVRSS